MLSPCCVAADCLACCPAMAPRILSLDPWPATTGHGSTLGSTPLQPLLAYLLHTISIKPNYAPPELTNTNLTGTEHLRYQMGFEARLCFGRACVLATGPNNTSKPFSPKPRNAPLATRPDAPPPAPPAGGRPCSLSCPCAPLPPKPQPPFARRTSSGAVQVRHSWRGGAAGRGQVLAVPSICTLGICPIAPNPLKVENSGR